MTPRRRALIVGSLALGLLWAAAAPAPAAKPIVYSKHNLSAGGPPGLARTSEPRVCVFCHTPHNPSPAAPLWNRRESGRTYIPYTSSSLDALVGQPTGASKLCLSCHDGTIALGDMLRPGRGGPREPGRFMPSGPSLLGVDLRDDHPISFVYDSSLALQDRQLRLPSTLTRAVQLDFNGELQCTSCHDPHNDEFGKFLVMDNVQSALCVECHNMTGWDFSSHKLATSAWNQIPPDPWPTTEWNTVADNGCESCHQPHTAPGAQRLLHALNEEDTCYACHNGNVARANVQVDFMKASRHPVHLTTGVHEPDEVPSLMPRHVECQDCHNPHATRATDAMPPEVPGALDEVSGVTLSGVRVEPANYEYEVCFKCHADTPNRPGSYVSRMSSQSNTRLEFSASNASYHPVVAPGRNPAADMPSLVGMPYSASSLIHCTDCHNSDTGAGAGGSGPDGPHGSLYAPILERQYRLADNAAEDPQAYALCYKCHNRSSILSDQSFKEHDKHVRGENTPCFVCHDPHGESVNNHLINFATGIVTPSSNGRLEFIDLGRFQGSCSLTCHGQDHRAESYQ